MNATTTSARHRAARRPLTPLSEIAKTVGGSNAGRRAAVVATAGGLLVSTFGATAAQAAPVDHDAANKLSTVDLSALTEQAKSALQAAPVVAVDADATMDVEMVTKKIAAKAEITPAPEPEPEPEPEPVVESTTTEAASRSTERTAVSSDSSLGAQAVSIAMRYVGTPYVVGGSSPSGMDCSGLTSYVYAQLGVDLPRTSSDQHYAGTIVSSAEARPGDLVWTPGHIAIYAGDGKVVEASRALGWEVGYRDMWQTNPTYIRVL
ncbi:NlpC/P60 family protein [Isoptericola sp. NEAU-Y5]|uniref:NlpC/P60 family protein n=1 Tax=Isoptericola luteus TaxID=2879484 RepID=A0ABS7ZD71_9MICO|nr:C40 family peptidase [Isoptericola sp. NEAU-Y5]MCA5892990.1 NlpC/P60 family protein [Isoptericola sp. NEAU-Y5]